MHNLTVSSLTSLVLPAIWSAVTDLARMTIPRHKHTYMHIDEKHAHSYPLTKSSHDIHE